MRRSVPINSVVNAVRRALKTDGVLNWFYEQARIPPRNSQSAGKVTRISVDTSLSQNARRTAGYVRHHERIREVLQMCFRVPGTVSTFR